MEITALQNRHSAADIPPEQLAGSSRLTEAEKVAEGARLFEALLVRQILQESQKTVIQSKFSDNSNTAGIYRDLVTEQLAESISKSGSLGLAQSLERQLTRQLHRTSPAGPASTPTASPTAPAGSDAARPSLADAQTGVFVPAGRAPAASDGLARGRAVSPVHRP